MFKRETLGASILYWLAVTMFIAALVAAWAGAVHALTYRELAQQIEAEYNLPTGLLVGICEIESSWRPWAVGTRGEIGLCQLMPTTLTMLCPKCDPTILTNPYDNLHWAARYLTWLRLHLKTDEPLILAAAYNGGQDGKAVQYLKKYLRAQEVTP